MRRLSRWIFEELKALCADPVLLSILVAAAVLRLSSCLQYGFCDEAYILNNVFQFCAHKTIVPANAGYPTLFCYLATVPSSLAAVLLTQMGHLCSASDFASLIKLDSLAAYVPARLTSVFFGIGTVWLVFRLAEGLFDRTAATVAAAAIALSPVHIDRSALAVPDVTMTFFATCSLWYALKILSRRERKDYLLSGSFAGLTVAAKYNGVFVLLPIATAHIVNSWRGPLSGYFSRNVFWAMFAFVLSFVCACPALLIVPRLYFDTLLSQWEIARVGHMGMYGPPILTHIYMLLNTQTTLGLLLIGGAIYSLYRHRRQDIVLLSYVLPSFIYIGSLAKKELHLLLFILPALSLLSGRLFSDMVQQIAPPSRRKTASCILSFVVFALPLFSALGEAVDQVSKTDNRWIAYRWMQQNIPSGACVVKDEYPSFAPLLMRKSQMQELLSGPHRAFFEKRLAGARGFDIEEMDYTPQWMSNCRAEYLVISSYYYRAYTEGLAPPPGNPNFARFNARKKVYSELLSHSRSSVWELVKRFDSGKGPEILIFRRMPAGSGGL